MNCLVVADGVRAIWIDKDIGPIVILSYEIDDEFLIKLRVDNG